MYKLTLYRTAGAEAGPESVAVAVDDTAVVGMFVFVFVADPSGALFRNTLFAPTSWGLFGCVLVPPPLVPRSTGFPSLLWPEEARC